MFGCKLNRLLLSLVTTKLTAWPVSLGPAEIAVAHGNAPSAPASSETFCGGPATNDGASLTGFTEIVAVWTELVSDPPFVMPPSSERVTEIVAEPYTSAAGVKVSVPSLDTAGCPLNKALLSFVTVKFSV